MRKRAVTFTLVTGLAFAASGCQSSTTRDLEGVQIKQPQRVEIYPNLDGHPNIVRMCIDGVAVMTTTREFDSVTLVPAWDAWCKS